MRELARLLGRVDLLETRVVAEVLEVDVVGEYLAGAQVLDDARVGQRVQVGTYHHRYVHLLLLLLVLVGSKLALRLLDDQLDLVGQHERLNELHVAVVRVPVDVSGADEQQLLVFAAAI